MVPGGGGPWEVTETDFGEFIIQLAHERPSHLVAPAVQSHAREHRPHPDGILRRGDAQRGRPAGEGRPTVLTRQVFARPTWGVTGVNFAVAETGTVVLVTNEGNGRLTTSCPRVHVAVMAWRRQYRE